MHATNRLNRMMLEDRTDQDGRFRLWFVPLRRTSYGVMARTARGSATFTVPDDVEREVKLLIR